MTTYHYPKTDAEWQQLRTTVITSTEMAVLFGASPYDTLRPMWERKRGGEIVEIEDNERMKWGTRLQDVIARGIADDRGWRVRKMSAFAVADDCRMGASFDFEVVSHADGPGILEIKNVDGLVARNQWVDDEAPPHIEIQLQTQLEVTGRSWGAIAALVGGNTPRVLVRQRDEAVGRVLRAKVGAFWDSILNSQPPPWDYTTDAAAIIALNAYAEPGKLLDARDDASLADACADYARLGKEIQRLDDERKAIKARLLERIGDHETVLTANGKLSAGIVGACQMAYTREAYRNLRFYAAKLKAAAS